MIRVILYWKIEATSLKKQPLGEKIELKIFVAMLRKSSFSITSIADITELAVVDMVCLKVCQ